MTMDIMGKSLYIVMDPDLVLACQKSSKTLDFYPVMLQGFQRLANVDADAMAILSKDLNQPGANYMSDEHKAEYAALTPGPALNAMNAAVMQRLTSLITTSAAASGKPIKLQAWIRHLFSIAATDALYGPANPISKDPALELAFWDFEADAKLLLVNILPSLTAPKGHRARELFATAFEAYFNADGERGAAKIIQERRRVATKYGLSLKQLSRWDIGMVLAVLANAVPTCFWLTAHILADPVLLSDLRAEVAPLMTRSADGKTVTFDISSLSASCPLYISTLQETLRLIGAISSSKAVLADTILADRYLLRKDGLVQIPGGVIHADKAVWGADAADFNPRRFIDVRNAEAKMNGAYRVFGGGVTMCPGRHFARTEIVAFVGMLTTAFDVSTTSGAGLKVPEQEIGFGISVRKPLSDVEVELKWREGFEGVEWVFETGVKA